VVSQLENLLADEGGNPFKGLFRFIPVESANSLLVISPKEQYLVKAKGWIERLDLAEAAGDSSERLFVYRVKHGSAENLADILTQLFSGGDGPRRSVGSVAPGLRTATAQSSGAGEGQGGATQAPKRAVASTVELSSPVSIVADVVNNSLLIRSSPRDYKKILDALKQLDLVPLQVLIEATIVEIRLRGSLQYGMDWTIFGGEPAGNRNDQRSVFSLNSANIPLAQGFSWAVVRSPDVIRATLSALAGDGLVNVLSSPSVMVLDNQTASIQVGQQVPTATSQQQGTSELDRVINQIQYRDTGVQLSVKPRVTPGGLVQMEIEQEVSTADQVDTLTPSFTTRNITSNVAVRSGQAVVLGGLMQDIRNDAKSGVPGFYNLPVVGPLFGERTRDADRTELVVVLTPLVIASDQDVEAVTTDFRNRMKGLEYRF
jgi:general secretion pathway protein D